MYFPHFFVFSIFPLYIFSPSPLLSLPSLFLSLFLFFLPFRSSFLAVFFPFSPLSFLSSFLSLLLFLFCTSLLIPFPPLLFLKYFFLWFVFNIPISYFLLVCPSLIFLLPLLFFSVIVLSKYYCGGSLMHRFRFWSLYLFRAPFSPSVSPHVYFQLSLPSSTPHSLFFPSLQFYSLISFSSFPPSPLFPHFPFLFLIQLFPFHLTNFLHLFPQNFYNLLSLSCHWLCNQMSPPP